MADFEILRDRILREAEAAYAERGFSGVSMRLVALTVGINPAMMNTLFGNKCNLLRIVEERERERQGQGVSD